jgi:site-specific DNA recombinase
MAMENAGIWLRVSSGGQDEANQRPDLERYCAGRYDVKREYEVHARSAYHGRQQRDLDQALADMRDGVIRVLVIWHSDRLERRPGKALLDTLSEFTKAGGRVESVQEPMLGQMDFSGQVTTFLAGLMNHEKSAHLSEQVGNAHDRIAGNGAFKGRIPFGYATEGPKYHKHLVPTEEGRRLVPEVYSRVLAGQSLHVIGTWLEQETGRPWHAKIVAELVRRPVYRGSHPVTRGDVTYFHRTDPLVDAATWGSANAELARRPKRGTVYAANRAMLAGALTCPACGSAMHRTRDGRGGASYYRCAGPPAAQRKSTCRNMARCELVDSAVNRIIAATFDVPVIVRTLVPGHDHSAELAEVRYELQQLPLRGLPRADEAAERDRLWAEEDRVAALPSVPDRYEEKPGRHTYAGLWEALSIPERGPWLAANGFRITADKAEVTVSQGDITATLAL